MRLFTVLLFVVASYIAHAQPKLIVGVVMDQMRYDYLYQFNDYYGGQGFNKLLAEGVVFHQTHYGYAPTVTGPGHASIYTGTTPAYHGIVSNTWWDKSRKRMIYCASDSSVQTVGSSSGAGQMSPHRMLSNTLGDAMQLFYGEKSKVFGVSLKDRGAILPAGHMADGAFWFDGKKNGKWVSSTYYYKDLPHWAQAFNQSGKAENYLAQTWEVSKGLENSNIEDDVDWERKPKGVKNSTFPYDLKTLAPFNGNYDILKSVPFGNDLTLDFATSLIKNEGLGKDDIPDLLAISFSATDYVGHQFGTRALELADTYVRLDQSIEKLIATLNKEVGEGNYLLFLTADHGAMPPSGFLQEKKIPSNVLSSKTIEKELNQFLEQKFQLKDLVESASYGQVIFNSSGISANNKKEVYSATKEWLNQFDGVDRVITGEDLMKTAGGDVVIEKLRNGHHPKLSGDIVFSLLPGWAFYSEEGSTHGSAYNYDTHVPLIFYTGENQSQQIYRKAYIRDIAPTISAYLKCTMPNAATGIVLQEIMKD